MRKHYLHIIVFLFAIRISAQTYDFRNFNVDDGLSQSQVFCIFQDSKGYMWFGTNGVGASNALNRKSPVTRGAPTPSSPFGVAVAEGVLHRRYRGVRGVR